MFWRGIMRLYNTLESLIQVNAGTGIDLSKFGYGMIGDGQGNVYTGQGHDFNHAQPLREPFVQGYLSPTGSMRLHLHGNGLNEITAGNLWNHDRSEKRSLDGYEASMASLRAENLGWKKYGSIESAQEAYDELRQVGEAIKNLYRGI